MGYYLEGTLLRKALQRKAMTKPFCSSLTLKAPCISHLYRMGVGVPLEVLNVYHIRVLEVFLFIVLLQICSKLPPKSSQNGMVVKSGRL